ncbi:ABC transporter permease [Roseomonas sp. AR75]|uniref:ABC transporter permease n=1 Tax=Roseomonas sp. AR75 TaxID=2562311 RepID=UPI0010C0A49F|nr:ABC transporter permease [Roseomonas sp. AR75]
MRTFLGALTRGSGWLGLIGILLITLLLLFAAFGPLLDLPDPTRTNLRARMAAPTISLFGVGPHPLGTDQLGRDILSRIVFGSRVTLAVAGAAVILGGIVGTLLGLVAGYFGGFLDRLLMRLADIQLAVPLMLLALMVIAALGPSLQNLVIVLALVSWVRYARIVRGQVLAVREREFVQSARAIGASAPRIILRHILPNVLTPAVVVATLELARVIVLEAGLSFLGLGVQPPFPSWGRMLAEGRTYIASAWWIITFPGIALMLTVLAVNLLGDWLRDHLDPRLKVR